MTRSRRTALAALAGWPFAAHAFDWGFSGTKGSGRIVRQETALPEFDAIELGGSMALTLHQAQGSRLIIETDDNLLDQIRATVTGRTLSLGLRSRIHATRLHLTADVWVLDKLIVAGSASISADVLVAKRLQLRTGGSGALKIGGLTAESVTVASGGSGAIKLAGQSNEMDLSVGGSGVVDASALQVRRASVSIGGAGLATVWASEALSGSVGGSGVLRYRGDAVVSVSHSGAGKVRKLAT